MANSVRPLDAKWTHGQRYEGITHASIAVEGGIQTCSLMRAHQNLAMQKTGQGVHTGGADSAKLKHFFPCAEK